MVKNAVLNLQSKGFLAEIAGFRHSNRKQAKAITRNFALWQIKILIDIPPMGKKLPAVEQACLYFVTYKGQEPKLSLTQVKEETNIRIQYLDFQGFHSETQTQDPHKHQAYLFVIPHERINEVLVHLENRPEMAEIPLIFLSHADEINELKAFCLKQNYKNAIFFDQAKQHPACLGWLIRYILQNEHYKTALSEVRRQNTILTEVMEKVFDLARGEIKDALDSNSAYQSILNYEARVSAAEQNSRRAFERLEEFRDAEILFLRNQLTAFEQLDDYRAREMKQTLDVLSATQQVLDLARVEEMEMSRIIQAQDDLRVFTDNEIRELMEENRRLKERLGDQG